MIVKAISLWEPWASLIRCGAKTYETRAQPTYYRGTLLICAAKGGMSRGELQEILDEPDIAKALGHSDPHKLLFGQAVALCTLVGCFRTERLRFDEYKNESSFGDYSPRRYAWKLTSIAAIVPFPVTGRQGLFDQSLVPALLKGEM